jgi:hypothetical protein
MLVVVAVLHTMVQVGLVVMEAEELGLMVAQLVEQVIRVQLILEVEVGPVVVTDLTDMLEVLES